MRARRGFSNANGAAIDEIRGGEDDAIGPGGDTVVRIREDKAMRLAVWSTTTPRENSSYPEMFRRQLAEVELAERLGIDQIWFFEHHLTPTAPVPSPNLLIAAAAQQTRRIRFASMVNILPFRHPLLVAEEAAMLDNLSRQSRNQTG